jgi:predicted transglutaminase-like protease
MAGAALAAAYYWFRSSLATPVESSDIAASISDNEALYILDARVSVDSLRNTLAESSQLNKKAAIWSGAAAILGALAALVSLF